MTKKEKLILHIAKIQDMLDKLSEKIEKDDWDDRKRWFANDGIDCLTRQREAA